MSNELFSYQENNVRDLLNDIGKGKIGLPDLQRPFVWKDNKIRDLLDSMIKGYPIGYIMLWASPEEYSSTKQIGIGDKKFKNPESLVIDGQQRLTALFAALYDIKVIDKNFKERQVKISYNPLEMKFAVWTQAEEKDAEWINSIREVFQAVEKGDIISFRKNYINTLNESRIKKELDVLSEQEEYTIENNLNKLVELRKYTIPTLKISSKANEEDVAEIFVRVNSGGQNLKEKNFIETLIAVYDKEVYDNMQIFCSQSRIASDGTSFNAILEIDPAHLIRMAVGLGFKRARLKYAYMLLRGKNLETGEITEQTRAKNLFTFKNALSIVTNLSHWHAFVNIVKRAGYFNKSIIPSNNAIIYSYILYLIGKIEYKVSAEKLTKMLSKWVFMAMISRLYTDSPESEVERQYADLRSINNAKEFEEYLSREIENKFTNDYFTHTLPNELNTSAAISPAWYGYVAAQNILGINTLFSTIPQSQFFMYGSNDKKKPIDKHHIYPKNHLQQIGYAEDRDRNQVANFTFLEAKDNILISDKAPEEYSAIFKEKLGEESYCKHLANHAIPQCFEKLEYKDFLSQLSCYSGS